MKKLILIATLVPFLQLFAAQAPFVFAPEKPFLAADIPVDNPQVELPHEKFDGKAFTIESWVAPGLGVGISDPAKAG